MERRDRVPDEQKPNSTDLSGKYFRLNPNDHIDERAAEVGEGACRTNVRMWVFSSAQLLGAFKPISSRSVDCPNISETGRFINAQ